MNESTPVEAGVSSSRTAADSVSIRQLISVSTVDIIAAAAVIWRLPDCFLISKAARAHNANLTAGNSQQIWLL